MIFLRWLVIVSGILLHLQLDLEWSNLVIFKEIVEGYFMPFG